MSHFDNSGMSGYRTIPDEPPVREMTNRERLAVERHKLLACMIEIVADFAKSLPPNGLPASWLMDPAEFGDSLADIAADVRKVAQDIADLRHEEE